MISLLTNPLIMKNMLYSEGMKKMYSVGIMKCYEEERRGRRRERTKNTLKREKKNLVIMFNDKSTKFEIVFERRTVNC